MRATLHLGVGMTGVRHELGCTGRLSARVVERNPQIAWWRDVSAIKGGDCLAALQLDTFYSRAGRRPVSEAEIRVGRVGVIALRQRLSDRDRLILERVSALRLLCAVQIQALLFADDQHASPATAALCCRRALERLTRYRLLVRLDRRVGGVRSGSASFVYALASLGQRVLGDDGARRRFAEPSERFVDHTLAVADLFVQLTVHARLRGWEVLEWQSEPDAWREVTTLGGRIVLRPDFFVVLDVDGYELRWFVEIDRATEHLPAITRKCRLYHSYYKGGHEQRRHKVFPRVLWVAPDERRAERLRTTIDGDRRLTSDLFRVTTGDEMLVAIGETT